MPRPFAAARRLFGILAVAVLWLWSARSGSLQSEARPRTPPELAREPVRTQPAIEPILRDDSSAQKPPAVRPPHRGARRRVAKNAAVPCRFSDIAVAVKTGRLVAYRLPSVLQTYAGDLCNLVVVTAYDTPELAAFGPAGQGVGARFVDLQPPQALIGSGRSDFVVEIGDRDRKRQYRALDVAGKLYTGDEGRARPLKLLHKDRWPQGEFDAFEADAKDKLRAFEARQRQSGAAVVQQPGESATSLATTAQKSEDLTSPVAVETKGRIHRLAKRGEGGTEAGHSLDHEKNIPAFVELFNRFPDAKWYILADDDTFLSIPALAAQFALWDPMEPRYTGKAFVFDGCNVDDPETYKYFANGGTGIILSRGAILKLLPYAQLAIEKTRGDRCWAGDVRIAVMGAEAGLKMDWPNDQEFRMHIGAQGPWHSFGRACDAILSYHLVSPERMRKLWDVEVAGTVITNADMWWLLGQQDKQVVELMELEGSFSENANAGGMDILKLTDDPERAEEIQKALVVGLRAVIAGTSQAAWHPPSLQTRLQIMQIEEGSARELTAALSLRCMEACHSLDNLTQLAGLPRPVDMFRGMVATPVDAINGSDVFGPCLMWTIDPSGICWLKSGFSKSEEIGDHWSGYIMGARERYEGVARDGPAGKRCGW